MPHAINSSLLLLLLLLLIITIITLLLPLFPSLPCISASSINSQGGNEASDDTVPIQQQQQQVMSMSMDPLERETLFNVMELMSSDREWRSSNPNPCSPGSSWPGIECKPRAAPVGAQDNLLHVSRLDFGAPPNPTCNHNATFPSAIFRLPFLQSIFFFDCFNGAETAISFPALPYPSLQQLSLRSNPSLIGGISSNISSLVSLQVLTLSQNRLHGVIPDAISSLRSLVHLDLSYNSFAGGIPSRIGRLKSLVGLDLSYNSFTGRIPPSIGDMALLQKLDLTSNSISDSIPDSIQKLTSLVFLALSNNKLHGGFPKRIDKLRNLQYLIVDENPMFAKLPLELGNLAKLQEIRLANSAYSGGIPASFAGLSNLTTLSLEGNRLTGQIPAALSGLGKLYHLNLSKNLLSGVVPFGGGFLKRLGSNLDLRENSGLCVNEPEGRQSRNLGLEVCGLRASSMATPLERSGGAPVLLSGFRCHLMTKSFTLLFVYVFLFTISQVI